MVAQARYTVEHLQPRHLPALQTLFFRMFGKRHSLAYLQAKYDVGYLGVQHASYIAMAGGRAVSFYGMIPMPARRMDSTVLIAQSCDYMTLPEFKSMGLHRELAGHAMERAKEEGASFAFALMSDNSLAVGKKMGWDFNPPMQVTSLPARKYSVRKAMYRFGLNSLLQDNAEAAFSDLLIEPSRFENSLSGTQFLYIHYSDDFFRYKKAGGGFHIEVNGVKLWLKGGLQLHIGDLCFEHEDQLEPALEEVRKRAAKAGFSEVIVQCNAQSPLEAYLSSRYALRPSFDVACSDIDGKSEMRFLRTNYGDFDTF